MRKENSRKRLHEPFLKLWILNSVDQDDVRMPALNLTPILRTRDCPPGIRLMGPNTVLDDEADSHAPSAERGND
jgi:hypothetical protein